MRAAWSLLLLLLGPALAEDVSPVGSNAFAIQGLVLPLASPDPGHEYEEALGELRGLGANHVVLSVRFFQRGAHGLPARDPNLVIPDTTLLGTIRNARDRNLAVILQPELHLSREDGGGALRGGPKPESWEMWFDAYERVLLHYARLASEADVAVLSLGNELDSAERHEGKWRALIGRVRTLFGGAVTYSAGPDRQEQVGFWDALDYVGLSGYWGLASPDAPDPEVEALGAAWEGIRARLLAWRKKARLRAPLLFLEVGYPSLEGCATAPWDPWRKEDVSTEAQRRCYEAFARTWRGTPALAGVVFHEWWGEGGSSDGGYTPRGKPAERVIRELFGVEAPPPPPPPREGVDPDLTPGVAPPR